MNKIGQNLIKHKNMKMIMLLKLMKMIKQIKATTKKMNFRKMFCRKIKRIKKKDNQYVKHVLL